MKKITVFSNTGCGKCKMLKRWLDSKGLEYKERNIAEDGEALNELIRNKRRSLPQIQVNNEFVDIEEYNDLLELIK